MKMDFDQLYELIREPSAKELIRIIYELNKEIEDLKELVFSVEHDLLGEMNRRDDDFDRKICNIHDAISRTEENELMHNDELWDKIYKIEDSIDGISECGDNDECDCNECCSKCQ